MAKLEEIIFDSGEELENLNGDIDDLKTQSFSLMLQNKGLSQLGKVAAEQFEEGYDKETKTSVVIRNDVSISLLSEFPETFKVSTHKTLDLLMILFTQQNTYGEDSTNNVVSFTLDDYLSLTNTPITKPNRDRLRYKLTSDLNLLYNLSLDWETADGEIIKRERLCTGFEIRNSKVNVFLNDRFTNRLTRSYFVDLPMKLFALPEYKQAVYYIGKKLAEQNTYELNKKRGTNDIISVKRLLSACPTIPTVEDVDKEKKYKHRVKIQKPFEEALNTLQDADVINWSYCNSKKAPLTEYQKEHFTFDSFLNSYIHFNIIKDNFNE